MATVEIDEQEFQQNKQLRDFVSRVTSNPKLKRELLKLEKAAFPERNIPEVPADPVEEALKAQSKAFEDYRKEQEDKEAKRESEEKLKSFSQKKEEGLKTLRQEGWMKEAIEEVEKIMSDQGILDPAIAAAFYEKNHPPVEPITPNSSSVGSAWNFTQVNDTDEYSKALLQSHGDDAGTLADRQVQMALSEIRRQRPR